MGVKELIEQVGFDSVGECAAADLRCRKEVRDMCAANTCQSYGKNWCCPPHNGPMEEYQEKMASFTNCHVVQTVMELEDEFDFETMVECEKLQKKRFTQLVNACHDAGLEVFPLGAGTCTICPKCGCPDEPCRFPDRAFISMEAAGLVVSEVCEKAQIPYNHGALTQCFSSCILV